MTAAGQIPELTPALEDYLETILELVQTRKIARVRDIADARSVKAGSVSPAMRRLADLGLIRYHQREYIDLTETGQEEAQRVMARHRVLRRFFAEVLRMDADAADREACAMEHNLSNTAMDKMVRLFEFIQACPEGKEGFLHLFHTCPIVNEGMPKCGRDCPRAGPGQNREEKPQSLADLTAGQSARVLRVDAEGAVRQRLLDMGLLPTTQVELERVAPGGDPIWIRMFGSQLALRRKEALAILVRPE